MVDPSLLRKNEAWVEKTHLILDEMVCRGNLIAGLRKAELEQLDETLTKLHSTSGNRVTTHHTATTQGFEGDHSAGGESVRDFSSSHSHMQFEPLRDWNSEEELSGEQLIAVADSLDFTNLDWLTAAPLDQSDSCLY